jgi:hypothetical protein
MRTLILNSSNIVPGTNNSQLQYQFPGGNIQLKEGQKVALSSLSMFYSTFNITAAYRNNTFNYIWVDGTVVTVVFPDGFYDANGINTYLHFIMVQNLHYLVSGGNFVYFITLGTNSSAYAIEVNCFTMSVALAATNLWTLPVGATWVIPTNIIVPMLEVLPNAFRQVIGFNAGKYPNAVIAGVPPAQTQTPAYTATQIFLSSFIPQITPLSSYILTCTLINNNYAIPNSLLYSFAPVGTFGNQFTVAPSGNLSFISVLAGMYNRFTMSFVDQNLNPVAIQDPNFVIMLLITDPDENGTVGKRF